MSPEYNWHIKADFLNDQDANKVRDVLLLIDGVLDVSPISIEKTDSNRGSLEGESNFKFNLDLVIEALCPPEDTPCSTLELTEIKELAEHFNDILGAKLPDDTQLQKLILPQSNLAGGRRVNPLVKSLYTRSMGQTIRIANTVGELRDLDEVRLLNQRHLGEKSVTFLVNAFKRQSD